VGSTQTSSTPILTKANSELTGNRLLASAIGVEKSPSKMSPGRARARSTFAKISGIDDASKHDFLNGHFQWPVSSDRQKIPTLVSLQVSTFFKILYVSFVRYHWLYQRFFSVTGYFVNELNLFLNKFSYLSKTKCKKSIWLSLKCQDCNNEIDSLGVIKC
jgi:hypothetical protein